MVVAKVRIPTVEGREADVRFRSRRKVAVRESDLPSPPPREISLMCLGEKIEMRLSTRQFGFAVYYMPAESERRLARLLEEFEEVTCVLVFEPSADREKPAGKSSL